jgi:DNA-binding CsgD family transcriptional regulator
MIADLVTSLSAAETCDEFRAAMLSGARPGVAVVATMDEFDGARSSLFCASTEPSLEASDAVQERLAWNERFPTLLDSVPVASAPPLAVSDVVGREEFRASRLYTAYYAGIGIEDELVIEFPAVAGPATLRLGRTEWGFDATTRALALEIQRVLTVMCTVRRERETVRAAAPVARLLAEESGRFVLVSDRAGNLIDVDGTPSQVEGVLASTIRSAVALANADAGTAEPGEPVIELSVPGSTGGPTTVQVLAGRDGSALLAILVQRPRAGVTPDDLRRHGLTGRQAEVMTLILEGATNGSVAHQLGISERTVEKHVYGAYARLGARTRTEALIALLG